MSWNNIVKLLYRTCVQLMREITKGKAEFIFKCPIRSL